MKLRGLLASAALMACVAGTVQANTPAHSTSNAEQRARDALAQMTLDEKIALLSGKLPLLMPAAKRPAVIGAGIVPGVPRLGIPDQLATDASLGVSNLLETRKGDVATAMPSGLAQAATWNIDLIRDGGRMIGSEARAKGFNVMLAGGVNLVRDPRAGRNFEYLGEDPLLAGRLAGAQISGVQSNQIISTIKHFALNDQETGRSSASVEMDEAAMRESDLLAFQLGIEIGNPGSVMCAYNLVGGIFACENKFLLTDVLRRDWGYQGFVMSDWGAVHSTEALLAGLDQQAGEQLDKRRYFSTDLTAAVKEGRISEAAVDQAAQRILYAMYAHGLVDNPVTGPVPIDYAANAQVAQRTAEEGIVLLRNEGNMLPLAKSAQTIIVIGGQADLGVPSGGGSSQVVPVGGFRKVLPLGNSIAATFARRGYGGTPPLDGIKAAFPQAQVSYVDASDRAAAVTAARAADVAIIFADKYSTEAEDSRDISLGEGQDELIDAVASANARTIVVLQTGNPVAMPWLSKVPAVLSAWYSGQNGGIAIGRILSGEVNPSGRLPVTFPADISHLPNPVLPGSTLPPPSKEERAVYGLQTNSPPFKITYPEGSDAGYRWFDAKGHKPLFSFGHGLSYTSFAYSDMQATRSGQTVSVRFTVTNNGKVAGADVPQIYARREGKARRLAAWDKVFLKPGESRVVNLQIEPRILADFDTRTHQWVIPAGKISIELARSATSPEQVRTVKLTATRIKP